MENLEIKMDETSLARRCCWVENSDNGIYRKHGKVTGNM